MSNFRHEHILSLLGVCLDNDPQFIILELMEGGDLLSFMRASRLSSVSILTPLNGFLMKTLWKKDKLLVLSNFSFCHNVFKSRLLQTNQNAYLSGKG